MMLRRVSSSRPLLLYVGLRSASSTVLSLPKADVFRFGDANRATPVFRSVEWTIQPNESWAVVGSGEKSLVFEMLSGHLRIHPSPGLLFPFLSDERDPHQCISLVSFANRRAAGGAFYDVSARYGAVREEDQYTLRQTMFPETITDLKSADAEEMGLTDLLDLPRIVLSNGQTRRARILKAFMGRPRLLLLDEPLTGLDVSNRSKVLSILHSLNHNPHIVLGLRTQDPVPDWITHLALVDDGAIRVGTTTEMLPYKAEMQQSTVTASTPPPASTESSNETVVEMKNVNVAYGPRRVLKDITWDICKGGRYHLQGTNGSGKTTLLALITGDHPQSYTQRTGKSALRLFGKPRHQIATPTLHASIGVFTPELFDAFPRSYPGMTVWEAVGTGFEGGYVPRGERAVGVLAKDGVGVLGEEERAARILRVWDVLRALGPAAWAHSPAADATEVFAQLRFPSLSVGEQRMVLLMRALVAKHPLVLLDEVFSGMDGRMVKAVHAYLQSGEGVESTQAVIVVTHVEEEVPWKEMTKVMLKDGELIVKEGETLRGPSLCSLDDGGLEPGSLHKKLKLQDN
ncbi:p-loop containing nucleoside triphosphate hydrolase protein [Mycena kentingensis (nom. inval.)]|nr:p-loop containing nucleoside triphosphate hydrolase protein [Mycena kentingensis (nom. inval.)]